MSILSLVLCGSVLLAQADPGSPPADDPLHLVVARSDRTHVAARFPLPDTDLRAASAIWAWTPDIPAQKLDALTASAGRERVLQALERLSSRTVRVRVPGWSTREELAAAYVVAAPVEMWGTVPEALLPRFPLSEQGWVDVPAHGAVRARVVGQGAGSLWEDAGESARTIDLVLRRPAVDIRLAVRTMEGEVVERAFGAVMTTRRGGLSPALEAQMASGEDGLLRIPALPELEIVTILVSSEDSPPTPISGAVSQLTRTILLPPAGEVRGRFVDEHGASVSGVDVRAEGWAVAELPALVGRETTSDGDGRWSIRGLPHGPVVVRAQADGFATFAAKVPIENKVADLGNVRLAPALDLTLTVMNESHEPIRNVQVKSDLGFEGRTDEAGLVYVTGLASDEPSILTLAARRFEKKSLRLAPPFETRQRVVLEAASSIEGKVVREDGNAAGPGTVVIVTTGNALRRFDVASDGSFELEVEPGEDLDLTFESPGDGSATRKLPAMTAGEVRRLGSIQLTSGLSISGRVIDSAGTPVAAARVWTIRSNAEGPLAAWVQGRVIESRSDAEGRFGLRGLTAGTTLLRVDALDYARAHRTVSLDESSPADAGDIELVRGTSVSVKAGRNDSTLARIDLLGRGLEADMLTAPILEGMAVLRNVPPGEYRVSVLAGRSVTCARMVVVGGLSEATVVCPPAMTVRGRVLLDGESASGGSLAWSREEGCDSLVTSRASPMGSLHQRTYGGCGSSVVTAVRHDGTFESKELTPGEWRVTWHAEGGAATPRIQVPVPDLPEATVVVRFSGGVVRGRVLDRDGRGVQEARVREVQGPLFALTSFDGSFTLRAVAAGIHRLQASLRSQTSRVVEVSVQPGSAVPEVLLELDEKKYDTSIRIVDATGAPGAGAFVFVVTATGIRTLTADSEGTVRTSFPEGLPERAKAVAFLRNEWAVGEIGRNSSRADEREGVVRFGPTGSLRIESRTTSGAAEVFNPSMGDLSWMFARLGTSLTVSPETPLLLHGLPLGAYDVKLGEAVTSASVSAGSTATARLP